MRIVIPNYRARSRNKTITSHWRTYQKERDEIASLIRAYASRKTFSCASVTIEAYYKGKRSIDCSNIDDKLILDGLMHAGILEDDDATHNPEIIKKVYINSGKDELHIEVIGLLEELTKKKPSDLFY
jgi:Holliday junction resolvase RusA-like endonuclease